MCEKLFDFDELEGEWIVHELVEEYHNKREIAEKKGRK